MMSPRSPPRGPALPTPRSVMYCPVATPAGILTLIVLSPRTRPSPLHLRQGEAMVVPAPLHVGHGDTLTNWPKNERCARRTSPVPAHVGQRCGVVPGSAPDAAQRSHGSSSFMLIARSTPVADSSS